tara:strand:- start:2480 stop:4420 length:1941 start_codon:yes stop_codon:yes gene_type:complete
MPFKSEKQRRYLWANEPEIARDWTDTYGSKIKKAEGGITRIPFRGGGADASTTSFSQSYDKMHKTNTAKSANKEMDRREREGQAQADRFNQQQRLKEEVRKQEKEKREELVEKFRHKNINNPLYKAMNYVPYIGMLNRMAGPFGNRGFFLDKVLKAGHYGGITEDDFYNKTIEEQEKAFKDYMRDRGLGKIDAYGRTIDPTRGGEGGQGYMGYPSYAAWQAAQGQGGTTVAEKVVEELSPFQQSLNTGVTSSIPYYVGADPTAANLAWGQSYGVDPRTMGRTTWADGGPIRQRYFLGKIVKKIGRAAKKVIKSPLGKIGLGIAALKLAPMAMGQWQGNTGFFGGRLKDFLLGAYKTQGGGDLPIREGGVWNWMKKNPWKTGIGAATLAPFLMGGGDDKEGETPFDYQGAKQAYLNELMKIKRDAMAGTLDPSQFVYQGIKDGGRIGYAGGGSEDPMLVDEYKKYVFEMEEQGLQPMSFDEFKRQALAGMARGGRAGYYEGGQSIPSENSLEDARKTAMQDRLGGITEVMKQADLYRQGDVGQMYMAEGGPTQEAGIMDLGGVEKDYRETGGFVPIGKEEKADDVPARLSLNEFVMTADAVRGMGDGDIDQGAERMEDLMETLEVKGKKNQGAQDMFEVSERLSAVV